jgi:hypothetical protein
MKVQTITAQAWWIAIADEVRPVGGLDVTAVFAAIKERFEFAAIPTAPTQQGGGLDFVNGALRATPEPVLINKIGIYTDGVNVEVPTTTERAETALQEVLSVFFSFGLRRPETPPLHYYLSTIVVDLEYSLDNLIPAKLLKKVEVSIGVDAKTHFSGININADKTTLSGRLGPINPTFFNVHRRVDVPYDQNRYFSQAHMETTEHLDILAEFEQLAKRGK